MGVALFLEHGVPVRAASSAGISRCSNVQLLIRPRAEQGAAGTVLVEYRIHDLQSASCSLQGFPGLELLDRNFHSLPTHVTRGDGVNIIARVPVRQVILDQQHDAYFLLEYHHIPTGSQSCPSAPYVMVTPPNDFLPDVTYSRIDYVCGGNLWVSAVMSTPAFR
jgi:hypothetical protein